MYPPRTSLEQDNWSIIPLGTKKFHITFSSHKAAVLQINFRGINHVSFTTYAFWLLALLA